VNAVSLTASESLSAVPPSRDSPWRPRELRMNDFSKVASPNSSEFSRPAHADAISCGRRTLETPFEKVVGERDKLLQTHAEAHQLKRGDSDVQELGRQI
jgi:hypothetical protein